MNENCNLKPSLVNPSEKFSRRPHCSSPPTIFSANNNKFTTGVKKLALPESNTELQTVAETAGKAYSGKTIVYLNGTTMDVRNYNASGVATTTNAVPWPANGVLYIKNNGACTGEIPTDADYDEPFACGNVYVSGTYSKPLTIAAANDVIIRPTVGAKLDNSSTNCARIIWLSLSFTSRPASARRPGR